MNRTCLSVLRAVLALLVFAGATPGRAATDSVFADSLENPFFVPANDAESARFLTQASFGPSRLEISRLRSMGYETWLADQFNQPITLARPWMDTLATNGVVLGQGQRMDRWFYTAALGPDQLRQRMAFALSQILVISDRNDNLSGDVTGVAEYWDILARGAFGNYRTLLGQVTLSPQMGKFLSHLRNRKASGTLSPDENYAREVMQLFTVGLEERNNDFSLMLDGLGQPIPTYDQTVVSNMARVLTGWSYPCPTPPGTCNTYNGLYSGSSSGANGYAPMVCFPFYTDTGSKALIAGLSVAAGPACDPTPSTQAGKDACAAYCSSQLTTALDYLFNHPNTGPFVSRQLIQRFVTSNPSPQYIDRVATVFNNNGQGVRGDLKAVLTAVLMDSEARIPPTDPAAPYGKLREPVLRLTALWRAFGVAAPTIAMGEQPMGERSPENTLSQRPLGASTVFNFYEPDYQQPGAIANANLYSPEFEIANESTLLISSNDLFSRVWKGYSTSTGTFTQPTDGAWLTISDLTPLASNPGALVDELNARLMYGSMTPAMRTELVNLATTGLASADANRKVLGLIHVIALSPEFVVQR